MLINILLAVAMWVVGILLYSIGVMQIILILCSAIPLTKIFSKIYPVDIAGVYRQCTVTGLLWTVISAVVIFLVMYFGNIYAKCGFWIGFVLSFLLSLGKWGANPSNVADYFQSFRKYYPQEALDDIFGTKNGKKR
ncbi:hypothetical protein [Pseudoflavonifractor phocaeensis]|uniref:hypothetical protein n=1 Tax=Pseudoflavonifractor phocaeensis TaxID=1870988 RepID=UPI001957A2FC|nr:hypothetical protein [Pseudoflavonifractor phocaeensis]MBM6871181.1 hypothetical protein [Pseudoflavonifractor phocaeensis]